MGRRRLFDRSWFARPPEVVAPELLNAIIEVGDRSGRIVEVEAYAGEADPASHAFRGPTPRTEVMFGRPGHLYVYLSYGMHWCSNVVAHEPGVAGAILLRAIEPLDGLEAMRADRPAARRPTDVGNGPGKLGQALGVGPQHLGADLCRAASTVRLRRDDVEPPTSPVIGPRIGISRAVEVPWRFSVPDSPYRSRPW